MKDMGRTIKVSARLLKIPTFCCCCGEAPGAKTYTATATRVTGTRVVRTHQRSWEFSICSACSRWIEAELSAARTRSFCLFSVLIFIGSLAFGYHGFASIGLITAFGAFFLMRTKKKKALSLKVNNICHIHPVVYHSWNGSVHTFEFRNHKISEEFQRGNSSKLVG